MIVSWNWLSQYLTLALPAEEIVRRLMMAGLNHESTAAVGDDLAIDLEVTSNRPDCLGHLGRGAGDRGLDRPGGEGPGRAAAGRGHAGGPVGSRADRLPAVVPPLHGPRGPRHHGQGQPAVARRPAGDRGPGGGQQRRGHLQLRAHGVRPAAAHLRLRQAPRAGDHRPRVRAPARRSRPSTTRPTPWSRGCASSPTRGTRWPSPA